MADDDEVTAWKKLNFKIKEVMKLSYSETWDLVVKINLVRNGIANDATRVRSYFKLDLEDVTWFVCKKSSKNLFFVKMCEIVFLIQFDSETINYKPKEEKTLPNTDGKKCFEISKKLFEKNIETAKTKLDNCLKENTEKYERELNATSDKVAKLEENLDMIFKSVCPNVGHKKRMNCLTEVSIAYEQFDSTVTLYWNHLGPENIGSYSF